MEYLVEWEIELRADNPISAAKLALGILRDPDSMSTVFTTYGGGITTVVDLEQEET